jgi:hypothetical protein
MESRRILLLFAYTKKRLVFCLHTNPCGWEGFGMNRNTVVGLIFVLAMAGLQSGCPSDGCDCEEIVVTAFSEDVSALLEVATQGDGPTSGNPATATGSRYGEFHVSVRPSKRQFQEWWTTPESPLHGSTLSSTSFRPLDGVSIEAVIPENVTAISFVRADLTSISVNGRVFAPTSSWDEFIGFVEEDPPGIDGHIRSEFHETPTGMLLQVYSNYMSPVVIGAEPTSAGGIPWRVVWVHSDPDFSYAASSITTMGNAAFEAKASSGALPAGFAISGSVIGNGWVSGWPQGKLLNPRILPICEEGSPVPSAVFLARPAAGYEVDYWTWSNGVTAFYDERVPELLRVETCNMGQFVEVTFREMNTLTESVLGDGVIKRSPSKFFYSRNEDVVLTAEPCCNSSSFFVTWSGTLEGALIDGNQVTLPMDRPRSITALFGSSDN